MVHPNKNMKPTPQEISHVLIEFREALDEAGILSLVRAESASDLCNGLVINKKYANDAAKMAHDYGYPVTFSEQKHLGLTIITALY